jgi:hypothetical protein
VSNNHKQFFLQAITGSNDARIMRGNEYPHLKGKPSEWEAENAPLSATQRSYLLNLQPDFDLRLLNNMTRIEAAAKIKELESQV